MANIRRIFLNVSMTNRINGLQSVATQAGIKISDMKDGDYLIFVNAEKNKIAALVGDQNTDHQHVMAYTKLGRGQVVDLRTLIELPRHFDGKKLNYNASLKDAINKAMNRKLRTGVIESIG